MRHTTPLAAALLLSIPAPALAQPTDTAFTYQGRLTTDGCPQDTPIEALFRLYDGPNLLDSPVGDHVLMQIDPDSRGVFTALLDFGPIFPADTALYLEIALPDPMAPGEYLPLLPRTPLTAAPLAAYALDTPTRSLGEITGDRAEIGPTGPLTLRINEPVDGLALVKGTGPNPQSTTLSLDALTFPQSSSIMSNPGSLTLGNTAASVELKSGTNSVRVTDSDVGVNAKRSVTIDADTGVTIKGGNAVLGVSSAGITLDAQAISLLPDTALNAEAISVNISAASTMDLTAALLDINASTILAGNHTFAPGATHLEGSLTITASAFKPGGGPWSILSDARHKKNVEPLEGALATIDALRPVRFEYTEPSHPLYAPGRLDGFIAQDVLPIRPDWVDTDASGALTLTPRGFEALIVAALQELQDAHDQRLEALEADNAALRARLDALERALARP